MSGRLSFVGAGPGAPDLITLRGARRIAEADVVVWAASLVAEEIVTTHARPDAEVVDSAALSMEDLLPLYTRAAEEGLKVARVHTGDPSLYGAILEQIEMCEGLDLEVEVVPGVSAFSALAAATRRELTVPRVSQSVVITRIAGKTPVPDGEGIASFAAHGTTMAVYLSASRSRQLAAELLAGGYPEDTPVLVGYRVSWPDEMVVAATVGTLEATVKEHRLWKHTLFLVGPALAASGRRSHLYHPGHFHTYRRPDPAARAEVRDDARAELRAAHAAAKAAAGRPVAVPAPDVPADVPADALQGTDGARTPAP